MSNRAQFGRYLVILAVVGLLTTVTISAALAPPVEQSDATTEVGDRTLVGVHGEGTLMMHTADGEEVWRTANNSGYFDVTYLDNGSVVTATAIEDATACGPYDAPCTRTGFQIINNTGEPSVNWEWTFPVPRTMNNEVHDVEVLPNTEFLVVDMMHERLLHIVPGEGVTWQWNASSYYDAPDAPTETDWLHMNDVDRIDDGKYLLSVRNKNQLLILDREDGVVDVVNKDGSPDVIKEQHNPQWLGDGNILVSDSENDRVVELSQNTTTNTWEPVWTLTEAGDIAFDWPRDADRLPNGNTLITDSRNNRVVEVQPNGSVVWGVTTPNWPYEAERLPFGERAGNLPHMEASESAERIEQSMDIPGVSQLYAGLSYVVALPHWYNELQFTATILAVLTFLCGVGLIGLASFRDS